MYMINVNFNLYHHICHCIFALFESEAGSGWGILLVDAKNAFIVNRGYSGVLFALAIL